MSLLRRAERWLFGPETWARFRVALAGLSVLVGLRLALSPFPALAVQPDALFDPPWFLRALPSMPPVGAIVALQVLGTVAAAVAAAAILGIGHPPRHRRFAFALAWACLLVLAGLRASRGKILHNDLLLLFGCVPFLLAPRSAPADPVAPSPSVGWPLRAAMVVIVVAYFRAGIGKVLTSGLSWVFSDNMRWIMLTAARHDPPRAPTDAVSQFVVDHPVLAMALAGAVLTFELSAPLVLALPRTRPAFALAAAGLHVGTWLTIGLDYWTWAAVVALVLVDWPAVAAATRRRHGTRRRLTPRAGLVDRRSPSGSHSA